MLSSSLTGHKAALTAIATVGAGDELLRPLVAILLLGPQAEAADGDWLCHRLAEGKSRGWGREGTRKRRRESGDRQST